MSKTLLAREALKFVKSGMVVGLGSGTTACEFIKALAEMNNTRFKTASLEGRRKTQFKTALLEINAV